MGHALERVPCKLMNPKHIPGECGRDEHVPVHKIVGQVRKNRARCTCGKGVISGPRTRAKATGVDRLEQQVKASSKLAMNKTSPTKQTGNRKSNKNGLGRFHQTGPLSPNTFNGTAVNGIRLTPTPMDRAASTKAAHCSPTPSKVLPLLGNDIRTTRVPVGRTSPHDFSRLL